MIGNSKGHLLENTFQKSSNMYSSILKLQYGRSELNKQRINESLLKNFRIKVMLMKFLLEIKSNVFLLFVLERNKIIKNEEKQAYRGNSTIFYRSDREV